MKFLVSGLITAVLTLSFDAFAESNPGLDVNDVAVLFPLDSSFQTFPHIELAEGQLLPQTLLDELLTAATSKRVKAPGNVSMSSHQEWHIVGFRYDPCASRSIPSIISPCLQEIRLVAQVASAEGPQDTAMHLIYQLGEGDLKADDPVALDLLQTKQKAESLSSLSTSGQFLGVHPILKQALATGNQEIANLYKDFILRHATADKLVEVTMMGIPELTHWVFLGGRIQDGHWNQAAIPNLPEGNSTFVELNKASAAATFSPMPVDSSISTALYFAKKALQPEDLENVSHALDKIENLDIVNRNNVDCVSCHSATTVRVTPRMSKFAQLADLSQNLPQNISAFPAPRILQNHMFHWNLRAFGYFGNLPSMNMRVVLESGRSADLANLGLGKKNPGLACADKKKELMSCLIKSSTPFSKENAGDECRALCDAAPQDAGNRRR